MPSDSAILAKAIAENQGVFPLEAALVARDWLPAGRRLGLREEQYDVGERGVICERWLASTTHADNRIGPDDEGISQIRLSSGELLDLAAAVAADPVAILGVEYANTHSGLGRLAKIYDFGARIPFHVHPPTEIAQRVGRSSKDEAYYFPSGVDMGAHPETFFGVHPGIAQDLLSDLLLQELVAWDSDDILRYSRAYKQMPEDGFFLPSGVLHAPGTALTIELQEDSDTLAMFQALNAGTIISKDLLFKDVSDEERSERGEAALIDWLDWEANSDPYFYANRHTAAVVFHDSAAATEAWIFYGSPKFSGKRLVVKPGQSYISKERGVFNILAWRGMGTVAGHALTGGSPGKDELLIVHERAVQPIEYVNTGSTDLTIIKFFGPDIHPDAPTLTLRR